MRTRILALTAALVLMLSACAGDETADTAEPIPGPTPPVTTPAPDNDATTARPSPEETMPVTASWSTDDVLVPFGGTVPPTPTLVALRVGSHPAEGYDRVALEFDGLPGYEVGYRNEIVYDGSGEPVDLPGKAFIQLVFNPAQAHDDDGNPTLSAPPVDPVGVGSTGLESYVLNGDFEGYVSVALGLTGELGFRVDHFRNEDGNDVVYIDVARP